MGWRLCRGGLETQVRILAPQALRAAGVTPAISIPVQRTLRRIREVLTSIGAHSAKSTHEGRLPLENETPDEILQEEVRAVDIEAGRPLFARNQN